MKRLITQNCFYSIVVLSILSLYFAVSVNSVQLKPGFVAEPKETYSYCQAERLDPSNYPLPTSPTAKLVTVQLLTRHGDRTPVNVIPNDDATFNFCDLTQVSTFNDSDSLPASVMKLPTILSNNPYHRSIWKGNCLNGQLTSKGIQQLNELGGIIRSVYVDKLKFLNGTFDATSSDLYVRSTDIWRTQQSAESLLSGLFPDLRGKKTSIPIHTFPEESETMYGNPSACYNYAYLQYYLSQSADWVSHVTDNQALLDRLNTAFDTSSLSGWNSSFDKFFDNLQVRTCHGLPLPCSREAGSAGACVSDSDAQTVFGLGDWEYQYTFLTYNQTATAQLGIGAFTAVIRDVFAATSAVESKKQRQQEQQEQQEQDEQQEQQEQESLPKFFYYSGHDSTVGAVLGALNVTGWRWPPYASNLLFELWFDSQQPLDSQYFVRIIYNGQLLQLLACPSEECPLNVWLSYMDSVIPADFDKACFQQ